MKKKWMRLTLVLAGVLLIILTVIAFPFLPETVALHYGLSGADTFGPKWRLLLVPGMLATLCNFILFGVYEFSQKKAQPASSEGGGFSIITCLGFMILFDAISIFSSQSVFRWCRQMGIAGGGATPRTPWLPAIDFRRGLLISSFTQVLRKRGVPVAIITNI